MGESEFNPTGLLERQKFFKNHDFYILHGNFQFKVPDWVNQFGENLVQMGVPKDQVHTPHLKNLFADYKLWRKDSGLPNKQEDSEKAILIGHSSGAEMALVYAEHHKVNGMILFAPYDKPNTGGAIGSLISPLEKASGMFTKGNPEKPGILHRIEREFKWDLIARNCGFVVIAHSTGDTHLVPEASSKNVYNKLKKSSENTNISYLSLGGKGHDPETEQLAQIVSNCIIINP